MDLLLASLPLQPSQFSIATKLSLRLQLAMACFTLNFNVDVNKCFNGLLKPSGWPKADIIEKLKKDMEKLKAKRDNIRSKIEEAKREGNLATPEAQKWQGDLESLEDQVAAIFEDFTRIPLHNNNIKIGAWGGRGAKSFDIGRSASLITKVGLHHGDVIDSMEVSYVVDRNNVETGRLGGGGGHLHDTFELGPGEYINGMFGSVCEYFGETCISQLKFETNFGKHYGPFGIAGGHKFIVPVEDGRIVGFFGHSTKYLNSIGVYLTSN